MTLPRAGCSCRCPSCIITVRSILTISSQRCRGGHSSVLQTSFPTFPAGAVPRRRPWVLFSLPDPESHSEFPLPPPQGPRVENWSPVRLQFAAGGNTVIPANGIIIFQVYGVTHEEIFWWLSLKGAWSHIKICLSAGCTYIEIIGAFWGLHGGEDSSRVLLGCDAV
jgi:hypothetical protein